MFFSPAPKSSADPPVVRFVERFRFRYRVSVRPCTSACAAASAVAALSRPPCPHTRLNGPAARREARSSSLPAVGRDTHHLRASLIALPSSLPAARSPLQPAYSPPQRCGHARRACPLRHASSSCSLARRRLRRCCRPPHRLPAAGSGAAASSAWLAPLPGRAGQARLARVGRAPGSPALLPPRDRATRFCGDGQHAGSAPRRSAPASLAGSVGFPEGLGRGDSLRLPRRSLTAARPQRTPVA
jgi:hypothetical protein